MSSEGERKVSVTDASAEPSTMKPGLSAAEAEKLVKKHKKQEIKIISGVGVREYYRKLGYKIDENKVYMIKKL